MKFDLYVDRKDVLKGLSPEDTASIDTLWLMSESSRGRLLPRVLRSEVRIEREEERLGCRIGFVVWPRDGREEGRYDHLRFRPLRADVEGQDPDGVVERSGGFDGGITSFPFHRSVRGAATHPAGEEVQCYPTSTNEYLRPFGVDAVDECLRLTGATRVALPLYGLGHVAYPRKFLCRLVRRCDRLYVERVSFWSAKHLDKNDYARPFLREDLPSLAAAMAPIVAEPPALSLEERVARLEKLHGLG